MLLIIIIIILIHFTELEDGIAEISKFKIYWLGWQTRNSGKNCISSEKAGQLSAGRIPVELGFLFH